MNTENVKVGDIFSTESRLIRALGEVPKEGNSKTSQLKDIRCYFEYKKTGKLSRGKETNEIVITKKYNEVEIKENMENMPKVGRPYKIKL